MANELRRLTDRDRWLLDLLHDHRVLTTEHIAQCAFDSRPRALNRLGQLYQRQILDRFRHYQRPGSQSWRWTLGPLGAGVLAAAAGRTLPRPATVRQETLRLSASGRLPHLLGANGVFTALHAAARQDATGTTSLGRWWNETQATRHAGGLVRPDGHGLWTHGQTQTPFWLEYDTGTETLGQLTTKLTTGYAQLAGTPVCYPVLFVLPAAAREQHLHAAWNATGIPDGLTVATTHTPPTTPDPTAPRSTAAAGPAGPVWRTWPRPAEAPRLRLSDVGHPGRASVG
ncbi:replication-relaxation family protein [Cryptosporangium sp. NPDC048952]|uniref:replication-relaxation family protein n=1 Tax=Cryptosporangium sp. NPDC048952 TaxID=3363961 RepID=UPI00371968A8